ncbi:MAG TPA: histidine phosphatase family protein [Edaphobacter sp.]|jgi:probable phosphoglycerate mutase|nr:histidine phosphatase family protein [Edaphobacter sp.]
MTEPAAPAVTKIILVRHGQSLANAGGVTADHDSNPLTELGRQQAKDLVDEIGCKPTLIVISPFLRAQQTAEPLRRRFPDVPVEEWPIQEFTFLEPSLYRNTSEMDRDPHIATYWERKDPNFVDGYGAESFHAFVERARDAIRRLATRNSGGCVVIVSHGFFMQAFRLLLLFPNATDAQLMANFRRFHYVNFIHNVDSLEFELYGGKIQLIGQPLPASFNLQGETSHA